MIDKKKLEKFGGQSKGNKVFTILESGKPIKSLKPRKVFQITESGRRIDPNQTRAWKYWSETFGNKKEVRKK